MARESQIGKWNSPSGLLRLRQAVHCQPLQAEICEQIGVPVRTFRRWCTQDQRIKQAISIGAEAALASVENALFKKAQSGDLGAMCFFLKNRDPEHWSEHPELRGYDGKVIFVDDIPKTAAPKPAQAAAETQQPDHS